MIDVEDAQGYADFNCVCGNKSDDIDGHWLSHKKVYSCKFPPPPPHFFLESPDFVLCEMIRGRRGSLSISPCK